METALVGAGGVIPSFFHKFFQIIFQKTIDK
nr:MAG TPA: hypothetical protein [Caudoviricetes sp.]